MDINNLNNDGKKSISILGSTGSIGQSTIDLIKRYKKLYKVISLTANTNAALLAKQANDTGAEFVVIADQKKYKELKREISNPKIEIAFATKPPAAAPMNKAGENTPPNKPNPIAKINFPPRILEELISRNVEYTPPSTTIVVNGFQWIVLITLLRE